MAEDKKERDKEGLIKDVTGDKNSDLNVIELLDPEMIGRKGLPIPLTGKKIDIGPDVEELQKSKIKEMADHENYNRPASHVIKDTTATIAPYLVDGITYGLVKAGTKSAAKKSGTRTLNRILDKVSAGFGKIKSYDRAQKLGDPEIVKKAKQVERLNNEIVTADRQVNNAVYGVYDDVISKITNGKKLTKKQAYKLYDAIDVLRHNRDDVREDLTERVANALKDVMEKDGLDIYGFSDPYELIEFMSSNPTEAERMLNDLRSIRELEGGYNYISPAQADKYAKKANKKVNKSASKAVKELKNNETSNAVNKIKEAVYNGSGSPYSVGRLPSDAEKAHARAAILKSMKKNNKDYSLFQRLMDPKDPIYKTLTANSKDIINSDSAIRGYIDRGMSYQEAVQSKLLDMAFEHADKDYWEQLAKLSVRDDVTGDFQKIINKHPFRNADGTLKPEDEIIKAISKDPSYEEMAKIFIEKELKLADRANLYSTVKAAEKTSIPLLGSFVERTIKNNKENAKAYDPFTKKAIDFLPTELQPFNPKLVSDPIDKVFHNIGDIFSLTHDTDPSRFSEQQLKDIRTSLMEVAHDIGYENPNQIKVLSDVDMLKLLNSIGANKYGYDVRKRVSGRINELLGD